MNLRISFSLICVKGLITVSKEYRCIEIDSWCDLGGDPDPKGWGSSFGVTSRQRNFPKYWVVLLNIPFYLVEN